MTTAVSPQNLHPRRGPDREDDDVRYYDGVSFASDNYVGWVIGKLRLGKADLSRMRSSGCPVLRSHQPDNVVGRVMRVEKAEGVWRSNWELPKIGANSVTFQQMDAGILRGVSVGGSLLMNTMVIDNPDETDWDDLLLTCDWVLVEQSLTAVPADTTSGIDRSLAAVLERDGAIFDTIISPEGIFTKDTLVLRDHIGDLLREHNQQVSVRRENAMTTQTIPPDVLERAVNERLAGDSANKQLTGLVERMVELTAEVTAEGQRNMEYRAKLDSLQYQPNGQVLQWNNWNPANDPLLDFGKVIRLYADRDAGFPRLDRANTTLEESIIERTELAAPGPQTVSRIPWSMFEERERELQLQRATLTDGAGARPLDITVLGNGGLLLSTSAPILSRMMVRAGVVGGQKSPWASAQPTAAAGAEGSDITISTLTLTDTEYLPKSIAAAYEVNSSLQAADDGTFSMLIELAIREVVSEQLVTQVLNGNGGNEIQGIWGTTGVPNLDYGAGATDFDRDDVLDWFDNVRLAKSDGGMYTTVMGDGLWKLMEKTPRGTDGTSSAGYTEISQYLLETGAPHMGMVEGEQSFHYSALSPTGVTNPGLFFKADRCLLWLYGDSLFLEYVPQTSRKTIWKLVAEANFIINRPAQNAARSLAGNPDSPQAVVFLTSIIDEIVGVATDYADYHAISRWNTSALRSAKPGQWLSGQTSRIKQA